MYCLMLVSGNEGRHDVSGLARNSLLGIGAEKIQNSNVGGPSQEDITATLNQPISWASYCNNATS
jgi:hypothetical protein